MNGRAGILISIICTLTTFAMSLLSLFTVMFGCGLGGGCDDVKDIFKIIFLPQSLLHVSGIVSLVFTIFYITKKQRRFLWIVVFCTIVSILLAFKFTLLPEIIRFDLYDWLIYGILIP